MENEHGDVRPISDDSVSELPSSHVALPTETLTEMGTENQAELSYEEEDEGEIMVEIVGSDVLLDGVITHKDGDLVPGKVGNLDSHVWDDREEYNTKNFPEATAISSEGGENNVLENDSGIHCEEINVLVHEKDCLSEEIKGITYEQDTFQNDVHDENEGCLKDFIGIEHEEMQRKKQEQVMSINIDQVLDFEDLAGVSDVVLEHEVQQTKGLNEPSQLADDVDDPLLNKDMSHEIHTEAYTTCLGSTEEECGSPQTEELEVSVEKTELLDADDYEVENFSFIPNEVNGVDSYADISSLDGVDVPEILEGHISESEFVDVEERYFDPNNHHEKEVEELSFETNKLKSPSYLRMDQSGYLSPPERDGQFLVSDLVWGKVRSHPWWPGQIFDPSDASETAVKHQKRDSYLVAYFGDRTFAWNDASLLKPFRLQFSQIEKHSNSEAFQNAVNSALDEVARRVELGLACSCIPIGSYGKIKYQIVENAGIREESCQRQGVDQSSKAASFEPDKLLQYVRQLAPAANLGADRLDIVIAQAQISAFCRFKGYRLPTGIASSIQWSENDAGTEQLGDEIVSQGEKMKPLTDSTECFPGAAKEPVAKDVSVYSRNKRKTVDIREDRSDKKVSVYAAKETIQAPKPSFKIGECIRRVASQLTGSTSMAKGESEIDSSLNISEYSGTEYIAVSAVPSSLNEKLSQLQQVAQDPNQSYTFVNKMVNFFSGFKTSVFVNKRARKKKTDADFEFDDINDSYWTDRVVQNHSEKQLVPTGEHGALNLQEVSINGEKTTKSNRRPSTRKRYSTVNYPTASVVDIDESAKRRKQESSPAELILIFAERICVPSEINLNKMFRRFGPLMESETEVDHDTGRAKVIYKRGSDAQVAHSSAEKFKIFGPVLVNYEIGYSPLISMKVLPIALPQFQEDAALMP